MQGPLALIQLCVGTNGNDDNSGSQDKPFKTIKKARDNIRIMKNSTSGLPEGGIVVTIAAGDYDFTQGSLNFTNQDSGTPRSPITYVYSDMLYTLMPYIDVDIQVVLIPVKPALLEVNISTGRNFKLQYKTQ